MNDLESRKMITHKKIKIEDIADIQLGFPFRRRLKENPNKKVRVLQMGDLSGPILKDFENLLKADLNGVKEKYFLQSGDIVFRTRGNIHTATMITGDTQNIVLAAPLMRIRIKNIKIDPAFLTWIINHPMNQQYFGTEAKGSAVKMIHQSALANLQISVPPQEKQERIIAMSELLQKELYLINELRQKKRAYFDAILFQQYTH